jgi:hypothetical protein
MTVATILNTLRDAGLTIVLSDIGGITVTSATRPTDELRDLIRANKPALLAWLHAANDPVVSKDEKRADDPPAVADGPEANEDVATWITRRRVTGHEKMRPDTLAKFAATSAALDHQIGDATDADPDRNCWPNDPSLDAAMNAGEIETFMARVTLFMHRGLGLARAEALADKLKTRDRDGDDRRLCMECRHLASTRCTRPQAAGIGPMVEVFRAKLQRCPAFDGVAL